MKKIKTLKTSWLLLAMVIAVVIGEFVGSLVGTLAGIRVPPVPVAAVCVGLVAFTVSLIYDGTD
jgi:hypothetical protein